MSDQPEWVEREAHERERLLNDALQNVTAEQFPHLAELLANSPPPTPEQQAAAYDAILNIATMARRANRGENP